jgi:hypothetical protein
LFHQCPPLNGLLHPLLLQLAIWAIGEDVPYPGHTENMLNHYSPWSF